jgi:hypothetical protein
VGFVAAARLVLEGQSRFRPNKRLQLALLRFVQRPLLSAEVSSLQLVTSRFGLCSVVPRAPQGAAEAQSR